MWTSRVRRGTNWWHTNPFIPGLRDIPRWIPVHRLIWRDSSNQMAGQPEARPEPAGRK